MNNTNHSGSFGKSAVLYSAFRKPYPASLYKMILAHCRILPKDILDIGCGTGLSTEGLARPNTHVVGCDHDPAMIREARRSARNRRKNIDYFIASAYKLPFEDETFDLITIGTAFHWFATQRTLVEAKRVLKKGGTLCIYWTLGSENSNTTYPIPADVFRQVGWQKVPDRLRSPSFVKALLREAKFSGVTARTIATKRRDTIDEHIGLLKTASSYILLRPNLKRAFVRQVKSVLMNALSPRKYLDIYEDIHLCIGIKKL